MFTKREFGKKKNLDMDKSKDDSALEIEQPDSARDLSGS